MGTNGCRSRIKIWVLTDPFLFARVFRSCPAISLSGRKNIQKGVDNCGNVWYYILTEKERGKKMKVLDYVSQNDIQKFYCKTTTNIILVHTHRSRTGRETEISELFGRKNLCQLKDWNKYKSFYSFADKEIVKIENFMDIPIFYVDFNNAEWQKEIKSIFIENKRNFNYHIALEF